MSQQRQSDELSEVGSQTSRVSSILRSPGKKSGKKHPESGSRVRFAPDVDLQESALAAPENDVLMESLGSDFEAELREEYGDDPSSPKGNSRLYDPGLNDSIDSFDAAPGSPIETESNNDGDVANMDDVTSAEEVKAAITIQAHVRGHQARRRLRQQTAGDDAKVESAALTIQAQVRGDDARRKLAETEAARADEVDGEDSDGNAATVAAATRIQAQVRGDQNRQLVAEEDAARRIQTQVRGDQNRRLVAEEDAARTIQAQVRGDAARFALAAGEELPTAAAAPAPAVAAPAPKKKDVPLAAKKTASAVKPEKPAARDKSSLRPDASAEKPLPPLVSPRTNASAAIVSPTQPRGTFGRVTLGRPERLSQIPRAQKKPPTGYFKKIAPTKVLGFPNWQAPVKVSHSEIDTVALTETTMQLDMKRAEREVAVERSNSRSLEAMVAKQEKDIAKLQLQLNATRRELESVEVRSSNGSAPRLQNGHTESVESPAGSPLTADAEPLKNTSTRQKLPSTPLSDGLRTSINPEKAVGMKTAINKLFGDKWDFSGSTEEEAMKQLFALFDSDKSGDIDREEFQALVFMTGKALTVTQTKQLFDSIDTDGSGGIDLEEFIAWSQRGGLSDLQDPTSAALPADSFAENIAGFYSSDEPTWQAAFKRTFAREIVVKLSAKLGGRELNYEGFRSLVEGERANAKWGAKWFRILERTPGAAMFEVYITRNGKTWLRTSSSVVLASNGEVVQLRMGDQIPKDSMAVFAARMEEYADALADDYAATSWEQAFETTMSAACQRQISETEGGIMQDRETFKEQERSIAGLVEPGVFKVNSMFDGIVRFTITSGSDASVSEALVDKDGRASLIRIY